MIPVTGTAHPKALPVLPEASFKKKTSSLSNSELHATDTFPVVDTRGSAALRGGTRILSAAVHTDPHLKSTLFQEELLSLLRYRDTEETLTSSLTNTLQTGSAPQMD